MSVSVTVESRCASVTVNGTVYGPPPTRNVDPGSEISICADPMPGDVVGTAAGLAGVVDGVSGVVGVVGVGGGVTVGCAIGGAAGGTAGCGSAGDGVVGGAGV